MNGFRLLADLLSKRSYIDEFFALALAAMFGTTEDEVRYVLGLFYLFIYRYSYICVYVLLFRNPSGNACV
jgi:hypothetical protein